jgi:hypothetical protein
MTNRFVLRWGLGAVLAGAVLPFQAHAQTPPPPPPEPTVVPAPLPTEPAPAVTPAPAEVPPPTEQPTPMVAEVTPPPPLPAADIPAEEEPPAIPAPTVNGYVEAGYHINFTEKRVSRAIPMRVYDPAGNSFALHAAHLALTEKFTDAISAVVEIDAGRDAVANGGGAYPWKIDPQFGFDVQEAYANYASGIFTLTAGKFVTYEGIEVIEGPLNPTITRGFLFGYAEPFTHTGVKAHFQLGSIVNFGVGVVNGWDLIGDNNQGKTVLARLALFTPSDPFFAALSGSVGPEQPGNSKNQRVSVDLTGAITPSAAFALWYQFNVGNEKHPLAAPDVTATWWGFGLQPVLTIDAFSLGGRIEYFADPKAARSPGGNFFNITVTPGVKLADVFKLRAEFRADIASKAVLGKVDSMGLGTGKSQITGAVSAEYTF